ncbi:hypothetical protein AAZX31_05G228600 [Glycine max]|uniref:Plastid lipid-associated protein/fibrillin conserved domain-containing protein n=1 Tax=Glycine max TaxID=3847 RepID=I1K5F3_SOYBN|nr:uncharacterized protein LOC100785302 [Glycine max]KAG5030289.1 hypothetical protein JHK87_013803 [Glycine soja]KAG5041796.1 hypothetical protein JHK85_014272 [Glycine max]KAG5058909.1 hypothetical protein JHK86_013905 [Glycine max]KAH1079812.1 hypothetical protein GYH30_056979 [Glycine max]KAH1251907.1 hypothetical protein GmHk_05G014670 [Glycine max]|eukprot:XP_003525204.1 uncharacterized protein LOC100785302 [Glycine max]
MAMSSIHTLYAFSFRLCFPNSSPQFKPLNAIPLRRTKHYNNNNNNVKFPRERTRTRATLDDVETDQLSSIPLVENEKAKKDVEESVKVLKDAAKTRKVAAEEILSALSIIEKAKVDPSAFFETLGGKESPGRTWMLIFTAEKQLKGGRYFPLTAVQRFDAAAKRIENGIYLGPIGQLTFEGRLSWKKRILAFVFENIRIKVGPLQPLEISLGKKEDKEPSTKDPFFIWFYVDEEIAVARGRSGGTAFWCRCRRANN